MTCEEHHLPETNRAGIEPAAELLSAAELQSLIDWYLAFRRAAVREHADIAPAVAAMNMDQMAVPVMIPLQAAVPSLCQSGRQNLQHAGQLRCLDLYHALFLDELTRLTAADPDHPTTNEVALAQIQLAMASFASGSFAGMIREAQP